MIICTPSPSSYPTPERAPRLLLAPVASGSVTLDVVHHCKAEDLLAALPTASIDLAVTSPPYDNLRRYNGFSWDFATIARETYRVLKPGGVLVWVVGDSVVDGSKSLTSFKQAIYFRECARFNLHDTMIWRKLTPGLYLNRYTPAWEFMFIFTKGKPSKFNPQLKRNNFGGKLAGGGSRNKSGFVPNTPVRIAEFGIMENVWDIQGGASLSDRNGHPAPFPEELARRHILTWSNPGDVVLDFFGGSGTTAKVARSLGRRYITCDISSEYCDLMRRRLTQPFTLPLDVFAAARGSADATTQQLALGV